MKGARRSAHDARQYDRLRWRCRRGLLELDLVLLRFLERQYPDLSAPEQLAFDKLLETPDELLFEYVQGDRIPSDTDLKKVIEKLQEII